MICATRISSALLDRHPPPSLSYNIVPAPLLSFRRIDPATDAELAYSHYRNAAIASFGDGEHGSTYEAYVSWLRNRVEEFPDGNVIAMLGHQVIGQLELQVPYGLRIGYINLFYVTRPWRRLGFGRRLHEYAERYFQSWEADQIELHVAPHNTAAVRFYRSLGYKLAIVETTGGRMWKMQRQTLAKQFSP